MSAIALDHLARIDRGEKGANVSLPLVGKTP